MRVISHTLARRALAAAIGTTIFASTVNAEELRVRVRIENVAPQQGTFQTPFWIGFHNGEFDLYDRNQPASNDPRPGSVALERIAEDGNAQPLVDEFEALSDGIDAVLPGPNGPVAPGDVADSSFILDSDDPTTRYFSYASMVLPSNDFFIANGNPLAHPVFDDAGNFVFEPFFVQGAEVLDAGTEINDELPTNTAFFGQQTPDTGVDQNGSVAGIPEPGQPLLVGQERVAFQPAAPGNILGTQRFAMADFVVPGYSMIKVSLSSAPAIEELDIAFARASGALEVPPNDSRARGFALFDLEAGGTELRYRIFMAGLRDVTMAHLHLGAPGENGPVIVDLLTQNTDPRRARRFLDGTLTASDLSTSGPLAGQPLDSLSAAIADGRVYLNVHSSAFPAGEIRADLSAQLN